MLYEVLVQARDEYISHTNIEPVYHCLIGAPERMGNI